MIKLPKIFSDGCILQRGRKITIWGETDPAADVRITFQGQEFTLTADSDGAFKGKIGPFAVCEGEELQVVQLENDAAKEETRIVLKEVAVGEVWLAGGQSNMEFYLKYEKHYQEELEKLNAAPCPQIRTFEVPKLIYEGQEQEFDYSGTGIWLKAVPENIGKFSAVGYYFAKELQEIQQVPVGIINCSWGGTPSCAWMQEDSALEYGMIWEREFEQALAGRSLKEFIDEEVRNNPIFDKGTYGDDAFSEAVMPGTVSAEELAQGLGDAPKINRIGEALTRKPGILFEKMLKTVAPYTIKGMLYYQGESDDGPGKAELYDRMLKGVIGDWRMLWREALPFLYVQLPGFRKWLDVENQNFALIRQLQENVLYEAPGTYMASISDSGEEFDLHPKDKQVVGHRLLLLARKYVYGEQILCDAPFEDDFLIDGPYIRLHFKMAEGGLILDESEPLPIHIYLDEKPQELAWTARVNGEELFLKLEDPMALMQADVLRIQFARDPYYKVGLKNAAGIPALPFEIAEKISDPMF